MSLDRFRVRSYRLHGFDGGPVTALGHVEVGGIEAPEAGEREPA